MNKKLQIPSYICRFFLAAVFIFSGFVKAVDPLGSTYKIEDYLSAFGGIFELFTPIALPLGVLLAAFEFMLGVNMLFGISLKKTTVLMSLFMLVMTPLTLYIALYNPVSDCGCFGDALVIGNWTTFYKNIVLVVCLAFLWVTLNLQRPKLTEKTRLLLFCFAGFYILALEGHCLYHLPVFDFRPYKIGTYIPEKMVIPDDAETDVYETSFIYEKDGVQQTFTLDNYPADDSTWVFVDQVSKLIKKGYEPPIHDFSIELENVGDITDDVLNNQSYTFLLISHKLEKANLSKSIQLNKIYEYAQANGYDFYCLNASLDREREDYRDESGAKYPMATTDNITLKTIVRSNPGLVLIKGGVIYNKWNLHDLPEFTEPLESSELGLVATPKDFRTLVLLTLMFLVPTLVLICLDRIIIFIINKTHLKQK